MVTVYHLSVSVRGLLLQSDAELRGTYKHATKDDGSPYGSVREFREALMDELSKGHEVIPGYKQCRNFDHVKGCLGCPEIAKANAEEISRACPYRFAYTYEPCGKPTAEGMTLCKEHMKIICKSCGEQATHECSYAGQFVCGAPLCENCEGWEDRSKDSGSWGFMNHSHRVKPGGAPCS